MGSHQLGHLAGWAAQCQDFKEHKAWARSTLTQSLGESLGMRQGKPCAFQSVPKVSTLRRKQQALQTHHISIA